MTGAPRRWDRLCKHFTVQALARELGLTVVSPPSALREHLDNKLAARPSPFAVFRRRNFTLLWLAQFISTMGSGLTVIAASILVYRVTGSALSVGLILLVASLPSLLIGLIAGAVVDRFDRKRIMIAANLLCGAAIAAIPSALSFGIGWLYVLVALSSAVSQFFAPAQASVLPETAPDEELVTANAMMTISQYGALSVGYAAAGLIATVASLTPAFYLDALSFGLSALCILFIEVAPLGDEQESSPTAVVHNLRVGLDFVRRTPVLRSLVLLFVPIFCSYGFTNALQLPFATRALGATSFEYSLMEGVFSVGFIIGSLIMANVADRVHAGQWIAASILGMGACTVGLALSWSVSFAIACLTVIGVLNVPSYLGRQVLIQRTTPRAVRGRVSSVFFVARDAGFMVGMAAAGLADLFDVRLLVVISALVLLACGALALILPGIGQPSAEWRHMLAMLRAGPTAPGLGLGRAALAADIDRLSLRLPALEHLERVRTVVLCYSQSMPENASVAAVSGLLYRAMQRDEESGLPHVGPSSRRLGVRTGTGFATDIPVDRRGWVRPGTGGMSVAIDDPMNLHELRRPRILPGGRGKDPVWSIGPDHLGAKLVFRRDPYAPTRHGFIEPAEPMPLVRYEEELARTRANWSLVVSIG